MKLIIIMGLNNHCSQAVCSQVRVQCYKLVIVVALANVRENNTSMTIKIDIGHNIMYICNIRMFK